MKSSSSNQQHVAIRRSLATALLLFCVVAIGKIYAQEVPVDTWYCGIKLTVPGTYNMTNDITCPAGKTGIEIDANNVTLYMRGHSIVGAGGGGPFSYGVVNHGSSNLIEGLGTVRGFFNGVYLHGANSTVAHVHMENCSVAVLVDTDNNQILANTLRNISPGTTRNQIGVAYVTGTIISGNTITDGGVAIGIAGTSNTLIKTNFLLRNTAGIYGVQNSSSLMIETNEISTNAQYGILLVGAATITANYVNANGLDGIAVSQYGDRGNISITSNQANGNGRYGIAVGGAFGNPAGNNTTVTTNTALGNGMLDLYWDGNGTGNTWTANNCETWSLNMGSGTCVTP